MKVNGIIAEYNPFHNGHLYHLSQSKMATDSDYTIVVMSGNFMQRGDIALLEKHLRCQMALKNGADLVLELPAAYATSSAGEFAYGGVSLLNALGVVDTLSFGSECGKLDKLSRIADVISSEPENYLKCLQSKIVGGGSFPLARKKALEEYFHEKEILLDELISTPNNILALEYLQALNALHSEIQPFTLKRIESDYHSENLGDSISSATAIRKALLENVDLQQLERHLPANVFSQINNSTGRNYRKCKEILSAALFQKLYWETKAGFTRYLDVSESLSDRICSHLLQYRSFDDFAALLKTKELTLTRIRRCLLHIVLNLPARDTAQLHNPQPVPYGRVLGFRKEATPLLSAIKRRASIPLITKPADAGKLLSEEALRLFEQDIRISQFYLSLQYQALGGAIQNEYTLPIVIE